MRINTGAGQFSNTGRYGRLKDYAEEYAFTLVAHGLKQQIVKDKKFEAYRKEKK
jgi:hypothetical protein